MVSWKDLQSEEKKTEVENYIQMINAVSAIRDFQPESDAPEDGEEGTSEPYYEEFDEADAVVWFFRTSNSLEKMNIRGKFT